MHKTVFPERAVLELNLKKNDIVVDATFGEGGHSRAILEIIGEGGKLIAIDKDPAAIEKAKELQKSFFNIFPVHADFRNISVVLEQVSVAQVNGILFDFGLSQGQLDESGRGFSFRKEEKLDMRMNPEDHLTAEMIVNSYSEVDIQKIIKEYGEDYRARRIAKAIVREREKHRIETTLQLAELVMQTAKPRERRMRIHPATKTFQALRIAVNDELRAIKEALENAVSSLTGGGRCVAISFHSLEDRIVKQFFRMKAQEDSLRLITKKPIIVSEKERVENPRARSAKMRVAEKK